MQKSSEMLLVGMSESLLKVLVTQELQQQNQANQSLEHCCQRSKPSQCVCGQKEQELGSLQCFLHFIGMSVPKLPRICIREKKVFFWQLYNPGAQHYHILYKIPSDKLEAEGFGLQICGEGRRGIHLYFL